MYGRSVFCEKTEEETAELLRKIGEMDNCFCLLSSTSSTVAVLAAGGSGVDFDLNSFMVSCGSCLGEVWAFDKSAWNDDNHDL